MAPHSACPSLETWSREDQALLADELVMIPFGSMVDRMQMDWQRMRDGIRECRR